MEKKAMQTKMNTARDPRGCWLLWCSTAAQELAEEERKELDDALTERLRQFVSGAVPSAGEPEKKKKQVRRLPQLLYSDVELWPHELPIGRLREARKIVGAVLSTVVLASPAAVAAEEQEERSKVVARLCTRFLAKVDARRAKRHKSQGFLEDITEYLQEASIRLLAKQTGDWPSPPEGFDNLVDGAAGVADMEQLYTLRRAGDLLNAGSYEQLRQDFLGCLGYVRSHGESLASFASEKQAQDAQASGLYASGMVFTDTTGSNEQSRARAYTLDDVPGEDTDNELSSAEAASDAASDEEGSQAEGEADSADEANEAGAADGAPAAAKSAKRKATGRKVMSKKGKPVKRARKVKR
ncbi:hypothetical protein DIPPA_13239 [Diplonema papillatum]|nr:hypothetical protein DIPPA_13239 [Diplonema papillatum]